MICKIRSSKVAIIKEKLQSKLRKRRKSSLPLEKGLESRKSHMKNFFIISSKKKKNF